MGSCDVQAYYRSAMTAYHWEGDDPEENPNRPLPLCEAHWELYEDYWQSMWDEYNSGRL